MSLQSCYQTLGLHPFAKHTAADIRRAYLQKAKNTHPDRNTNKHATESFQHVQWCYEQLQAHHDTYEKHFDTDNVHGEFPSKETVNEVDIEDMKRAMEILTYKAKMFWNTSAEAQLIRRVWQSYMQRYKVSSPSTHANQNQNDDRSFDSMKDNDIYLSVSLTMYDIYFNVPQKLSYTRHRWNVDATCLKEEHVEFLLYPINRQYTYFKEGHRWTEYDAVGNVDVTIRAQQDDKLFIGTDLMLHYVVHCKKNESNKPKIIHLFNKEHFFVVPLLFKDDKPNSVCLKQCGLYDADARSRNDLIIDCKYDV